MCLVCVIVKLENKEFVGVGIKLKNYLTLNKKKHTHEICKRKIYSFKNAFKMINMI